MKNKTLVINMQHVKWKEIPPLRGPNYGSEVILPRKFIPEVELNYIQTVAARLQATLDYLKGKRYG